MNHRNSRQLITWQHFPWAYHFICSINTCSLAQKQICGLKSNDFNQ
uniref:Uncharacterized protein n=1 Tax=Rhizophora mucronata TaxID=61149 RepID=A0A2P2PSU6_RHIMU